MIGDHESSPQDSSAGSPESAPSTHASGSAEVHAPAEVLSTSHTVEVSGGGVGSNDALAANTELATAPAATLSSTSETAHSQASPVESHTAHALSAGSAASAPSGDRSNAAGEAPAPAAPSGPLVRRIMIGSQRDGSSRPQAPRHRVGGQQAGGQRSGQKQGGQAGPGQQGGPGNRERGARPQHGAQTSGAAQRGPRPPQAATRDPQAQRGEELASQDAPVADQASAAPLESNTPLSSDAPATEARPPREGRRERRPGTPRPPAVEATPQVTVQRPGRQTSADVEQEIADALEGLSVDEMMVGGSASGDELLEPQTRLQGSIVSIHQDNVFVELGQRHQGVLQLKQFTDPPGLGEVIEVIVQGFDPDEGLYQLTRSDAAATGIGEWAQLTEGMLVEARVVSSNKGGLECEVGNLRAFLPASHASLYRIEDLATMVGEKFAALVTEVNPRRRRLIISRRAVLEREKQEARERIRGEIQPGQEREGVVRSVMDFGAFIDLGGIDGLVHVSQLAWQRVQHPSEVLEIGQRVKVRVTKISAETGKISLSLKDLIENPWARVAAKYPTKSKVSGTVSRIAEFGAFVMLEPGIEGLVHISELAYHRVHRVTDVLQEGQTVDCEVLAVDPDAQRISLSVRALLPKPEMKSRGPEREEPEAAAASARPVSRKPLKGGVGRPTGGEAFGLKW